MSQVSPCIQVLFGLLYQGSCLMLHEQHCPDELTVQLALHLQLLRGGLNDVMGLMQEEVIIAAQGIRPDRCSPVVLAPLLQNPDPFTAHGEGTCIALRMRAHNVVASSLASGHSASSPQIQGKWCSNCAGLSHVPDMQRLDALWGDREWAVPMAGHAAQAWRCRCLVESMHRSGMWHWWLG